MMLSNPFWHALNTEHSELAIGSVEARRYPADVIPFGGVAEMNVHGMRALRELLAAGESILVTGDAVAECPGMEHVGALPGFQMHFRGALPPTSDGAATIEKLSAEDGPSMVALTDVAFPGYFRPRTYVLGSYYGIRVDGTLVAMAGERVALPGLREISAVCTHPAHIGRGYAAALIGELLRAHSADGWGSFLHVAANNERAIGLYRRLGFVKTADIVFNQVRRIG